MAMSSSYGRAYFTSTSHRTTNLASTNSTKLRAFPVALPPIEQQRQIVAYLSRRGDAVQRTCSAMVTAIDRLQEHRVALITAAVSGQIDVRDYANGAD
jgi:type I restriction enzyme S subunit